MVVDFVPVEKLKTPVSLYQIKADDRLSQMVLVNNSRLSVQPVAKEEFDIIVGMGQ
ncbi:MAG: EVE domain-containing protein [Cyclobacteriaceae bacterium]